MILNTCRLFCRLLRTLEVATVCDVGSMDGTDALRFRRILPSAEILALEPNPRNFTLMDANADFGRNSIRVLPFAASNRASIAPFFIVDADHASPVDVARRGMSSLHRRSDSSLIAEVVQVRTIRLDDLLPEEAPGATNIALWIDVEGMAFEAVEGAAGVLASILMIHVEVETREVIAPGQKLFSHVEQALTVAGFRLVATNQQQDSLQFNALFVRSNTLRAHRVAISCWIWLFRIRRLAGMAYGRLLRQVHRPERAPLRAERNRNQRTSR